MTMREEYAVAGRCHPATPGGDRSIPRADPRARGQEAMFLVQCSPFTSVRFSRSVMSDSL